MIKRCLFIEKRKTVRQNKFDARLYILPTKVVKNHPLFGEFLCPQEGYAAFTALEDENAVEIAFVGMSQGIARSLRVVRAGHQETVLDNDQPGLFAGMIVKWQLKIFRYKPLRYTAD